jgi:hypothetical protein
MRTSHEAHRSFCYKRYDYDTTHARKHVMDGSKRSRLAAVRGRQQPPRQPLLQSMRGAAGARLCRLDQHRSPSGSRLRSLLRGGQAARSATVSTLFPFYATFAHRGPQSRVSDLFCLLSGARGPVRTPQRVRPTVGLTADAVTIRRRSSFRTMTRARGIAYRCHRGTRDGAGAPIRLFNRGDRHHRDRLVSDNVRLYLRDIFAFAVRSRPLQFAPAMCFAGSRAHPFVHAEHGAVTACLSDPTRLLSPRGRRQRRCVGPDTPT